MIPYSSKLYLNFELIFLVLPKFLRETSIKVASDNGGLSEWYLFIMWSLGQHDIFLCKNAIAYFCNFELFTNVCYQETMLPCYHFISNMHTWKNILVHLKIFYHLDTRSYCFQSTVFVGKKMIFCQLYLLMPDRSHLLVLKASFKNIYILPCDLLGIHAYFN